MRALLDLKPVRLVPRSLHRIANGKGNEVFCLEGVVWITQEGDPNDIILNSGQHFVLDRKGVAVVYALRDAVITVGAPGHISPAPVPRAA